MTDCRDNICCLDIRRFCKLRAFSTKIGEAQNINDSTPNFEININPVEHAAKAGNHPVHNAPLTSVQPNTLSDRGT